MSKLACFSYEPPNTLRPHRQTAAFNMLHNKSAVSIDDVFFGCSWAKNGHTNAFADMSGQSEPNTELIINMERQAFTHAGCRDAGCGQVLLCGEAGKNRGRGC